MTNEYLQENEFPAFCRPCRFCREAAAYRSWMERNKRSEVETVCEYIRENGPVKINQIKELRSAMQTGAMTQDMSLLSSPISLKEMRPIKEKPSSIWLSI